MLERAVKDHPVWGEVAPELTPRDFNFPHQMNVNTLRHLHAVRILSGVPFRVVSDYREPDRNAVAGGAKGSAHMDDPCCAVDLRVLSSAERYKIVAAALKLGYERVGIYPPTANQKTQWGKNAGSVHLDDSPDHPAEVMWVAA